ncbi:MAG: MMPL family transporter, partial [Spirochaetota bacterium]
MRKWVLEGLVEIATQRRKLVLISSIIITVLSLVLSFRLSIDPRWSALLPEDMAVVREFMRIDEHYLQPSNMIIAVSGDDPLVIQEICDRASAIISDRMLVKPGMNNHEILESGRLVKHVYNRQPVEWMTKHMLALVKPEDAKRLRDLYNDPSLLGFLTHLNDDFEREYGDSASVEDDERNIVRSLDALERFSHLLRKAAHERVTDDEISRTVRDITVGNPYVMSLDNSMSLVLVAPAVSTDNIEGLIAMDRAIEQHLKPLESAYPEYAIERTGIVPISRDEMESVGPYTIAISIGALVAIFLLLMYNFRSAVTPILALVPVVTGIVWSMGFIALTLGVLNLITVMIMVVLLGLGIDFTIHLASRFYGEIASGSSVESAVSNMIEGTGKGVVTGALTTATAFLVLLVADVKAVSEFGFCAGFGIIFTLLASIWILPSLLAWRESGRRGNNRVTQP